MYTSTVPVEISSRTYMHRYCSNKLQHSKTLRYHSDLNSRVEHHPISRSTIANRWHQHTVNAGWLAAAAAGWEAQRQNGEDDYCDYAKVWAARPGRPGCLSWATCPACRAGLGLVSAPPLRVASRLAIVFTSSFKQRSKLSSWARAPSFFNPTLPHLGGVQ